MFPYYIYFGFSCILYLFHLNFKSSKKIDNLIFFILLIFIIFFTGLRYQVGSDWQNYHYEFLINNKDFYRSLYNRDVGFSLINFVFRNIYADYVVLNLFLSFISISSVFLFCKKNPNWFIGVFMAIPYFFTVCVMGYVRQGVSIAIIFVAIYALQYNKKILFLITVLIATTIHKSSIIFFPFFIFFFINKKDFFEYFFNLKKLFYSLIFLFFLFILFLFFVQLSDQWQAIYGYIKQNRESSGALIRAIMNMIPTSIFIIFNKKLQIPEKLEFVCYFFSILSITLFIIIAFNLFSSTFADRFGLSLIIFNVIIFSRISNLFSENFYKLIADINIILYNFLIMFVMLHYSINGKFLIYKLTPIYRLF